MAGCEKDYTIWTKPRDSWNETPSNLEVDDATKEEIDNASNRSESLGCDELKELSVSSETMRLILK